MKQWRIIYHLMRADVLERTRRYSFLVTMIASIYLGYAIYADYIVIDLDHHRGIYDSAWLGMLVALSTSMLVSLAGFYVVKNTITRDHQTKVGQILASTPVHKFSYIIGKMLSNFIVLSLIIAVQAVAALVMQAVKSESGNVNIVELFSPFILIALPVMIFIAGIAILFESIRWLRGGFGNVLYFFLWGIMLAVPIENDITAADLVFIKPVQQSMVADMIQKYPDYKGGFSLSAGHKESSMNYPTFQWTGMKWNSESVGLRFAWFGYAMVLAVFAALSFDRFDTAISRKQLREVFSKKKSAARRNDTLTSRLYSTLLLPFSFSFRSRFLRMFAAETRLMMKGMPLWWYIVALGLFIASIFAPLDAVKQYILPVLWLWPVLLWSGMGIREKEHRIDQIIFSSPDVLRRQLPAIWVAGVGVAFVLASGVAVRLFLNNELSPLAGLITGGLFIPSMSLALGVWSGSGKLFEALYTLIWYIGPMNHEPTFDYIGVSATSIAAGMPVVYAIFTGVLIIAAYYGRRRQLSI
jgi:hypothetical protein